MRRIESGDFSDLSLRDEILKAGGEILVLVHPFYSSGRHAGRHEQIEIRSILESLVPVFIFEEDDRLDDTNARLLSRGVVTKVCFVPTIMANPVPNFSEIKHFGDRWSLLCSLFKDLGVKNIRIGGRLLYKIIGESGFSGCVPNTFDELGKQFEVSYVPELCFPKEPKWDEVEKKWK